MASLSNLVDQLKSERNNLQQQLDALNAAINALGSSKEPRRGRRRGTMSAAARARIAAAQRARWAKWKRGQKKAA